ncbi:hypothetical protein HXX76_003883 [Chlamydomonas incerta]|uniref:very-long-chain 3-oxoacyl-CoA synthase n=1 Tax=Chlamydomonas incerta TaxID=51695 RepID=A0A835TLG5_CHLIN|nr:hypothetical protein HXX76_003883 [Chlamydomonas incerta]|eukprot:KAG2441030.1 hypothetical protein HXX76_003883 [Chlamydomonas incerta]
MAPPVVLFDLYTYKPPAEFKADQDAIASMWRSTGRYDEDDIRFMERVFANSGLSPTDTHLPPTLNPRFVGGSPRTDMEAAREECGMAVCGAVEGLLRKTGLRPRDIDILVTSCSAFCPTPSIASIVVNKFGMRADVQAYHLGGMGCANGVVGVNLVADLLKARPNSTAVFVTTETLTPTYYAGRDRHRLLGLLLFRMGGAAVCLTNKPALRRAAKYELLHRVRVHTGQSDDSFRAIHFDEDEEGHLGMYLGKNVCKEASNALALAMTRIAPRILTWRQLFAVAADMAQRRARKLLAPKATRPKAAAAAPPAPAALKAGVAGVHFVSGGGGGEGQGGGHPRQHDKRGGEAHNGEDASDTSVSGRSRSVSSSRGSGSTSTGSRRTGSASTSTGSGGAESDVSASAASARGHVAATADSAGSSEQASECGSPLPGAAAAAAEASFRSTPAPPPHLAAAADSGPCGLAWGGSNNNSNSNSACAPAAAAPAAAAPGGAPGSSAAGGSGGGKSSGSGNGSPSSAPYRPSLQHSTIRHFILHAGGARVLADLGSALQLDASRLAPSQNTLWDYGNVSSSTTWYALTHVETVGGVRRGERVLQVGVGSGIKCGVNVWKALRDIHEVHDAWAHRAAAAAAAAAPPPAAAAAATATYTTAAASGGAAAAAEPLKSRTAAALGGSAASPCSGGVGCGVGVGGATGGGFWGWLAAGPRSYRTAAAAAGKSAGTVSAVSVAAAAAASRDELAAECGMDPAALQCLVAVVTVAAVATALLLHVLLPALHPTYMRGV